MYIIPNGIIFYLICRFIMDFEILKTGKFISSNGVEKEFNLSDLEKIAAEYNPAVSEAPIVIGHPKTNDPAYGWIDSLKVSGDRLLASAKQIVPEFLESLKNGLFKKRSVSLTPDGYLRHVGFLGAELPAVKGLADISFSDDRSADESFEFSEELNSNDNQSEHTNDFSEPLSVILETLKNIQSTLEHQPSTIDPQPLPIIPQPSVSLSGTFTDKVEFFFQNGKLTVPMHQKLLELTQTEYNFSEFNLENYLTEFVELIPEIILLTDFARKPDEEKNSKLKSFDFSEFTLDSEAEQVHKKILEVLTEKNITYPEAAQIVFNS